MLPVLTKIRVLELNDRSLLLSGYEVYPPRGAKSNGPAFPQTWWRMLRKALDFAPAPVALLKIEDYCRLGGGERDISLLELMDSMPRTDGIVYEAESTDIEVKMAQDGCACSIPTSCRNRARTSGRPRPSCAPGRQRFLTASPWSRTMTAT